VTENARQTDRRAPDRGTPEEAEQERERIVIRDKRKIKVSDGKHAKSTTAEAAKAEAPAGDGVEEAAVDEARSNGDQADVVVIEPAREPDEESTGSPLGAELESLRGELDERTADLQRIGAEFANYRKRVDRDRALVVEQATGNVLAALLPILDDLDRARDHGDLVGPFGTVADQLITTLSKFGLTPFGSKGDRFDPTRHEAVAHLTSAEVTEPTCVDIMRRGYLLGERLLRPALVAVADPE
jgi:molecular chaperone GrpE